MNNTKNKISDLCCELRDNYGVIAVKSDLSAEMTNSIEMKIISDIAHEACLSFYVKIGGCDALNDIYSASLFNAESITSPMIESAYSCQKFIENYNIVSKNGFESNLRINIETANAYRNAEEILTRPFSSQINAVVMGRDDMAASVRLSRQNINSEIMFNAAQTLMFKVHALHKKFVLGGEIRPEAVPFILKLMPDMFETRKVVFDIEKIPQNYIEEGINKALELEILLLQLKMQINKFISKDVIERIEKLKYYTENSDILV